MNKEWSHTLGRFDIKEQWIGLDLKGLFLDPIKAESTLIHELAHSVISRSTEMGMATQAIFSMEDNLKYIDSGGKDMMIDTLFNSQKYVQEGFATFMEMQQIRSRTSINEMFAFKEELHPEYLARYETMEFVMRLSRKQRARFTAKVSHLSMQTGFRRDVYRYDLLRQPEAFCQYLMKIDNNPSKRLEMLIIAIKKNPQILKYKPRKLCRTAGINYFDPSNSVEVSKFINYLLVMCGEKPSHEPGLVGKVDNTQLLIESRESLLVSNMNLKLTENSEMLMTLEDIKYEAASCEVIFGTEYIPVIGGDIVEKHLGRKFEVSLILFRKTGEKYIAVVSREQANHLLGHELMGATFITKWGIVDPQTGYTTLSNDRCADVVFYNRPADMIETFRRRGEGARSYESLFMGYSESHPYQALIVRINGTNTLHFVNAYGSAGIHEVISYMKQSSRHHELEPNHLLDYANTINNAFATMGLPWDIDWVKTMVHRTEIFRR